MALPADIQAKVPVYKPGPVPFHDGELLVFEASWIGIPAASARVYFHKKRKDPSKWNAEVWVDTSPVADVFYKMRDYVHESVAGDTLHTNGVNVVLKEKSRVYNYDVTFDRQSHLVTETRQHKNATETREFIATDPWGPISGAMMALSQNLQAGKTYAFDVFSGSQRYVFAFAVEKRERIRTGLGDFDAWRVIPDVWYVSDGKLRSEAHDTVLWVSADARHLPLRIQAQAFIGYVRADLTKIDGQNGAESTQKSVQK